MSALINTGTKSRYFATFMLKLFLPVKSFKQKLSSPKKRATLSVVLVSMFGLSACHAGPEMVSTPVTGFNHTSASITSFTVNGAGGGHIPPFQGGAAQVCCSILPVQWNSGLRAIIEWDKDPKPRVSLKRDQYGQIVKGDYEQHASSYSHHKATVEIPRYENKLCALQVHFLPCDQVKVSTTCFTPEHPNYPDKAYFESKESNSCSSH